ncbi:MAG: DUF3050 domain-containing protein [Proteobacteria bacterium]|nr:DUF3050 domain-containing protein [Pseudomonadota bacterium]
MNNLEIVNEQLAPLIQKIKNHTLYATIDSIENLRIFMEYHVFAVWDFICLLKELYHRLVTTRAPWFPPKDPYSAHLISRILIEEENDHTADGQAHCSHFELYCQAMQAIHADTRSIHYFLNRLNEGDILIAAMESAGLSVAIQQFVLTTFSFFDQDIHILAAAFVYGREAITAAMFTPLIQQLQRAIPQPHQACIQPLLYYLNRHIELDHHEHFPQALKILHHLAGEDEKKWREIAVHARLALQSRLDFLSAIQEKIKQVETVT